MKWRNKIFRGVLWVCFCFVLIFSGASQVMACSGKKNVPAKYNWPVERKQDWNIVTLGTSKMKKFTMPKGTTRKGCYTQGGVITEKYYVVSSYCGDTSSKNRVYFVDRKTNAVVKYFEGKFGHMNALNYLWGTYQVLALGKNDIPDHCFQFGDKKSDFKEITLAECKVKRQTGFGVPNFDVKGRVVKELSGNEGGRLTHQGSAMANGYAYTAGWDGSCTNYGQIWTYKRNTNAMFVFDVEKKKLLKTFYLPSPSLEIEDVSVDGEGDVWLLYNRGSGKPAVFYEVKRADLNIPSLGTEQESTKEESGGGTETTKSGNDETEGALDAGEDDDYMEGALDALQDDDDKSDDKVGGNGSESAAEKNSGNGSGSGSGNGSSSSSGNGSSGDAGSGTSGGSVKTIILNAETMEDILKLVIEISAVVIPLVGVAGIGWMGIEYITAKGDEARTKKAKQRMIEIVIGLVIYAILYAILNFLGVGQ